MGAGEVRSEGDFLNLVLASGGGVGGGGGGLE